MISVHVRTQRRLLMFQECNTQSQHDYFRTLCVLVFCVLIFGSPKYRRPLTNHAVTYSPASKLSQ